jgi:hypothetical protein
MMRSFIATCALAAVVSAVGAPPASASTTHDKRTYFTFSQPVSLPGVTLPAGTYMFRLAAPYTERKVVQVTDREGRHSYAMFHTMPTTRMNQPLDSEIQFMETAEGMPSAVQAWWYVGERIGYEFVYPREQVRRLKEGVAPEPEFRTASADLNEAVAADVDDPAAVGVVEGEGVAAIETPAGSAAIVADDPVTSEPLAESPGFDPSEELAQAPEPGAAAPAEPTTADETTRTELPATAGPIGLVLVLGAASLAGGLWLRRRS